MAKLSVTIFVTVPPKIEFEDRLKTKQSLKGGANLNIAVIVTGTPKPATTWYKNDEILSNNDRTSIEANENLCKITTKSVKSTDGATYKVIAENEAGKDEAEFAVEVKGDFKTLNICLLML